MEKLIRCLKVTKKLIEIALLLWYAARRLDMMRLAAKLASWKTSICSAPSSQAASVQART